MTSDNNNRSREKLAPHIISKKGSLCGIGVLDEYPRGAATWTLARGPVDRQLRRNKCLGNSGGAALSFSGRSPCCTHHKL